MFRTPSTTAQPTFTVPETLPGTSTIQTMIHSIRQACARNTLVKTASLAIAALIVQVRAEAGVITQIQIDTTATTGTPFLASLEVTGTGDASAGGSNGVFTFTLLRNDLGIDTHSFRLTLPSVPGQDGYTWESITPLSTGNAQNVLWNPDALVPNSTSYLLLPGIGEELRTPGDHLATMNDLSLRTAGGVDQIGNYTFNPEDIEIELGIDGSLLTATSSITPAQFATNHTFFISGSTAPTTAVPEPTHVGLFATLAAAWAWLRRRAKSN